MEDHGVYQKKVDDWPMSLAPMIAELEGLAEKYNLGEEKI